MKYWTQSVGALRKFCNNKRKINILDRQVLYFQLAVQDICLARMFQLLEFASSVWVRVMESLDVAPNSTYT